MNKKAVSPVIAVMLLVAVAVAAVGAYFIWYKSFQAGSQKNVEEQTGTIGSKLRITNITNDNVTFYITIKNATGYSLVPDTDDVLTVDKDNRISDMEVTIKDSAGNSVTMRLGVNTSVFVKSSITTVAANSAKFTSAGGIENDEEGQIEVLITASDMNPGETYTLIITAAGVTSTEKYTAI
ncbi:MAG: hypothetical protein KAV80_04875 [Methanomicrobia archaeon]|nr:hypothetical protein [Methanomicrobia archaeon]